MKIALDTVIKTLDGKPYQTEDNKDADLKYFIMKSFDLIQEEDNQLSVEDKVKLFGIAKKVKAGKKSVEIAKEDCALLLGRMKPFSIPVIGAVSELLG